MTRETRVIDIKEKTGRSGPLVFVVVRHEISNAAGVAIAEEHDIAPLSPPNIDPSAIEVPKDGDLIYEFEVEVRPQFAVSDEIKGL